MTEWLMTCRCEQVALKASGSPIVSAACYCSDCQAAGHHLEQLSDAPRLVREDGGTALVLFRKDRIQVVEGQRFLEEYRLKPDSPTRRVVASCCNTPVFLDFTQGFWLSVYTDRFSGKAPPLQARTVVKERPAGVVLPEDVPNHQGHSGRFMVRLMLAWIAMGFRVPKLGAYPPLGAPASSRAEG